LATEVVYMMKLLSFNCITEKIKWDLDRWKWYKYDKWSRYSNSTQVLNDVQQHSVTIQLKFQTYWGQNVIIKFSRNITAGDSKDNLLKAHEEINWTKT
jgi:hypothetical protein